MRFAVIYRMGLSLRGPVRPVRGKAWLTTLHRYYVAMASTLFSKFFLIIRICAIVFIAIEYAQWNSFNFVLRRGNKVDFDARTSSRGISIVNRKRRPRHQPNRYPRDSSEMRSGVVYRSVIRDCSLSCSIGGLLLVVVGPCSAIVF